MADKEEVNYFEHLNELRNRLIFILLSVAALTVVSFLCSDRLLEVMTAPVRKSVGHLYFMSPYEAFLMRLKVSVTSGVVFGSPILFTQLWLFVAPGLYRSERKTVFPIVLISMALFLLGIVFAYLLVVPATLQFFLGFQTETLQPLISIGSYVSFFLSLILMFGLSFVLPVILAGLIHFGVLDAATLRRQRKVVVVFTFILAAILTPTMDVVTQCLLALPLWGLFEISLLVGERVKRNRHLKVR